MGLCGSKSSARSTAGSERSEKCRWDKHGNVFFPVRHAPGPIEDEDAAARRAFRQKTTFATLNPIYSEFDSPGRTRKSHFSSISKLLKGSKGTPIQVRQHPLSPSRSRRLATVGANAFCNGQRCVEECKNNASDQPRRHGTLKKFIEAEKSGNASLSRSSSAKEGSLTRSSSTKEAALSRCSSQKEGKRDFPSDSVTRPSPDHLAAIASLKASNCLKAGDRNVADRSQQSRSADEELEKPTMEISRVVEKIEAAIRQSSAKDGLPTSSSFLTKGIGLPSYQPMVFKSVSPEKCRGRSASAHSSLSSDELTSQLNRRRSPNRRSPGRRSPRKCSPNRKAGNTAFPLNSSAARFQRSLPGGRTEQVNHKMSNHKPPQAPKNAVKNRADQENRSVLKELPMNITSVRQQARRHSSPVKLANDSAQSKRQLKKPVASSNNCSNGNSERFSVHSDEIHLDIESGSSSDAFNKDGDRNILKEPRSGSKRLRSPKKLPAEQSMMQNVTKEYLNFNISMPGANGTSNKSVLGVKSTKNGRGEVPAEDKHIDIESAEMNMEDKEVLDQQVEEDCSTEPELLELLERTPKKLKKMALKLALMIELEHSGDEDDVSGELLQETNGNAKHDVDLELKLGMPNDKNNRRNGDGIRLDFSVAVDSPTRTGSVSVPMTPRHSVSSICNGLSVEARIGSSKGQSKSDFSFHILKNPDKLFGNAPRFHITKSEQTEETGTSNIRSSVFHVDASDNAVAVDMTATQEECEKRTVSNETSSKNSGASESNEPTSQVQRCSSFGFENDKRLPRKVVASDDEDITVIDSESTPTKVHGRRNLDLNRDIAGPEEEASPSFEFNVRSGKSSPATPIMPSAPKSTETDALSLSADEIAEIWGAFEAGQEGVSA